MPGRRRGRAARLLLRLGAGLVALLVTGAAAGAIYQAAASSIDDRDHPAPGVLVDVGGHRLHLWCSGTGAPTVVLESGLGGFSHDWSHLQPVVAAETRVCSYDRAGYGWSDGVDVPRSSTETAGALRDLLAAAGEEGPFVLVGHSIGGLHVRSFARLAPGEVAGMVLVDSSHENQATRLTMLDSLEDAQLGALATCRRLAPFGLPRLLGVHDQTVPDSLSVSAERRAAWSSRLYQTRFCNTVGDELRAAGIETGRREPPADLGSIPLIVLSSGDGPSIDDGPGVDGVTQADLDEATRIAAELQADLAALSTDSIHQIVPDAGHYIHWDRPTVTIDAIHHLVTAFRTAGSTGRADGPSDNP